MPDARLYDTTHVVDVRVEDGPDIPDSEARVRYLVNDVRSRWGFLVAGRFVDGLARGVVTIPGDMLSWNNRHADALIRDIHWSPNRTECLARLLTWRRWESTPWAETNRFVRESVCRLLNVREADPRRLSMLAPDFRIVIDDPRHGRLHWPPMWAATDEQRQRWQLDDVDHSRHTAARRLGAHPVNRRIDDAVRLDVSRMAADDAMREQVEREQAEPFFPGLAPQDGAIWHPDDGRGPFIRRAGRWVLLRDATRGLERVEFPHLRADEQIQFTHTTTYTAGEPVRRTASLNEQPQYTEETLSGRCEMCGSPDVGEGVCFDCGHSRIPRPERA